MWLDWLIRLLFLTWKARESFLLVLSSSLAGDCRVAEGVYVFMLQGFRREGLHRSSGLMTGRPSTVPMDNFTEGFPAILMRNTKVVWERYERAQPCRHRPLVWNINKCCFTHMHVTTHTIDTRSHRMWRSPLRLFARCRSMGIECGQGGLRIDRGPLQRCVFRDFGEDVVVVVGGGIHLGSWCCLLYLIGGRFYSTWVDM